MAAGMGGGQMMQMSLTGEIPLTRDNVLKTVKERGPIMEIDLLKALGHEVSVEQLGALDAVVKELCDEGEMHLSVFIDDLHVVRHKLHIGKHPQARCPVMGYGREDD